MEIKNAKIIIPTQKKCWGDTTIYNSLLKSSIRNIHMFNENKESLAKIYNEAIDTALEGNVDCLILVHDDVILEEDPIPKLEKLFDDYDLVGVAGASKIELKSPALWHIMGGGFYGGNLHGCVQHFGYDRNPDWDTNAKLVKQPSNFGKYPHKVVMIDGVFMALNRKAMETMRFDEDCPSKFHFYDCIFSLDAALKKLRVGVGDILITHESPGLRKFTNDWLEGEKYFFKKYEKYYGNILTI
jgi:hypothetical protein